MYAVIDSEKSYNMDFFEYVKRERKLTEAK